MGPVMPLEGVAVDEQNELLSDRSSGQSFASGRIPRVAPLRLVAIPFGSRLAENDRSARVCPVRA